MAQENAIHFADSLLFVYQVSMIQLFPRNELYSWKTKWNNITATILTKTRPPTKKTFYQGQSKYSSRSEAGQVREKHCMSLSLGSDTNATGPGKANTVVFLSAASGEQHFQVPKAILTLDQQLPHDTKEGVMECKCYTVTSSPRRGDRERNSMC